MSETEQTSLKRMIKCLVGFHVSNTKIILYSCWYDKNSEKQLVEKCIYCNKILKIKNGGKS